MPDAADDEALLEPLIAFDVGIEPIPGEPGEPLLGENFDAEFIIDEELAEALLKALQAFLAEETA